MTLINLPEYSNVALSPTCLYHGFTAAVSTYLHLKLSADIFDFDIQLVLC